MKTGNILKIESLDLIGEIVGFGPADIVYIVDRHGDQYKLYLSLYDDAYTIDDEPATTGEVKDLVKSKGRWYEIDFATNVEEIESNGMIVTVDITTDGELDEPVFYGSHNQYKAWRQKINAMLKRLDSDCKLPVIK